MASIHREITIQASAASAWDALRDVGALHTRLVPGFVVDTKLEPGARIVTFGDGSVVRELIIAVDEAQKRVVWSARTPAFEHHSSSAQVFELGAQQCRFVWIADLLPDTLAPMIAARIEQGLTIIKKTLEQA